MNFWNVDWISIHLSINRYYSTSSWKIVSVGFRNAGVGQPDDLSDIDVDISMYTQMTKKYSKAMY